MFIYYVYAYINQKTNLPYYIGKGKGDRAYRKHKHISVPNDKSKIVILETNLSNIGACAIERRLIRWYGRKGIDVNGILLNIAEGGEGRVGPISQKGRANIRVAQQKRFANMTQEQKDIQYSSRKGRTPWNKGVKQGPHKNPRKPYSEEAKQSFRGPRGPEAALKAWNTKRSRLEGLPGKSQS